MITKFKIYESLNKGKPEIGDYMLVDKNLNDELNNFTMNNIGKYIKNNDKFLHFKYLIVYENVPDNMKQYFYENEDTLFLKNCLKVSNTQIIYWSKNKEDLYPFITANKYNL